MTQFPIFNIKCTLFSTCKDQESHLVTITSKEEIEWLGKQIENLEGGTIWHTSGRYNSGSDNFYWRDGTGVLNEED